LIENPQAQEIRRLLAQHVQNEERARERRERRENNNNNNNNNVNNHNNHIETERPNNNQHHQAQSTFTEKEKKLKN